MGSVDTPHLREQVLFEAVVAVKKARREQAVLSVSLEVGRILETYPDCPVSTDELAFTIVRFCSWERVEMRWT